MERREALNDVVLDRSRAEVPCSLVLVQLRLERSHVVLRCRNKPGRVASARRKRISHRNEAE